MIWLNLIDVAPDPVGIGIVAVVVLLVIGFLLFAAGGLVIFLWYRKRKLRTSEMIRPEDQSSV
jgi:hypothetical protein